MKRRFGMWIGILCVLIVGVSVTRMTKDFVVSKGVAASSILHVMDTENFNAVPAGGALADSAVKNEIKISIPVDSGVEKKEMANEAVPEEQASVTSLETVPVSGASGAAAQPAAGQTNGPGAPSAENDSIQETVVSILNDSSAAADESTGEALAAVPEMEAVTEETSTAPESADGNSSAEELAAQKSLSANDPIQETVKSPLDPVVETKPVLVEEKVEKTSITADEFLDRFVIAEAASAKLWEKGTTENMVAYNAAAEQERVLWDYELNLVYDKIRERMSKEEAEALKHLELEWLKERDQYAEKIAAKSPMMNVQKQNPVYTRALAEKTKERCYWLVSEYKDILNRSLEDEKKIKAKKP